MEHRELYNIRIINISVGMTKDTGQKMEERLLELIEEAWAQGMVVVCAAGNNGPSPGSVTIPGNSRTVITVGAVDENGRGMSGGRGRGRGEPAGSMSYSGRGPTRECVVKPEILAPGTDIVSCGTTGGYTKKTGTSMAVPVVSGAVALMLEKDPALAPVRSNFGCTSAAFRCDILTEAETGGGFICPICFFKSRRTGGHTDVRRRAARERADKAVSDNSAEKWLSRSFSRRSTARNRDFSLRGNS